MERAGPRSTLSPSLVRTPDAHDRRAVVIIGSVGRAANSRVRSMADLRPEHPPQGCVANTDTCTFRNRRGEVCGLYADTHRPVRKRKPGRKQSKNLRAIIDHLAWKIRASIVREMTILTRQKKKRSAIIPATTECECGSLRRDHDAAWPYARGECRGFRAKMRKAVVVVCCIDCHFPFYNTIELDQHRDTSEHPEKWGPCKGWRRVLVCCANCRRQFFYVKAFRKHEKQLDVCKNYIKRGEEMRREAKAEEEKKKTSPHSRKRTVV